MSIRLEDVRPGIEIISYDSEVNPIHLVIHSISLAKVTFEDGIWLPMSSVINWCDLPIVAKPITPRLALID